MLPILLHVNLPKEVFTSKKKKTSNTGAVAASGYKYDGSLRHGCARDDVEISSREPLLLYIRSWSGRKEEVKRSNSRVRSHERNRRYSSLFSHWRNEEPKNNTTIDKRAHGALQLSGPRSSHDKDDQSHYFFSFRAAFCGIRVCIIHCFIFVLPSFFFFFYFLNASSGRCPVRE